MPKKSIEIEQATFRRLQRHTKRPVDTTDRVIMRALDALSRESSRQLDPLDLPDLAYTEIRDARINGEQIKEVRLEGWAGMRRAMLARAYVGNVKDLPRQIQGLKKTQSANNACKIIVAAAQRLGFSLEIRIRWKDTGRAKVCAAYPGDQGIIQVRNTHS